jgi:hypothetical protein
MAVPPEAAGHPAGAEDLGASGGPTQDRCVGEARELDQRLQALSVDPVCWGSGQRCAKGAEGSPACRCGRG